MTAEGVSAAARVGKQMTRAEADQILGVEAGSTWEEVSKVSRFQEGNGGWSPCVRLGLGSARRRQRGLPACLVLHGEQTAWLGVGNARTVLHISLHRMSRAMSGGFGMCDRELAIPRLPPRVCVCVWLCVLM